MHASTTSLWHSTIHIHVQFYVVQLRNIINGVNNCCLQIDPTDACYNIGTHTSDVLDSNLLSMTEKMRLELAIRLQQVQKRIAKALANVGIITDFRVG